MGEGIAYIRDKVMPAVQQMDGCAGLSIVAERDSGRCIVTTSWIDHESLKASAASVLGMRQRAAEILDGPAEVQEWEVALMHRLHTAHHGACTRVIWTEGDPGDLDEMSEKFRASILPQLDDLIGCCSVSVMLDRGTGQAVVTTTYDSPQDMVASRERAMAMREEFTRQVDRKITEVAEFELVLAHLRVPETV